MVTVPQASDAVTEAISTGGTVSPHSTVISEGQIIVGTVGSAVQVTLVEAVAELPQPSVAVNILVND